MCNVYELIILQYTDIMHVPGCCDIRAWGGLGEAPSSGTSTL